MSQPITYYQDGTIEQGGRRFSHYFGNLGRAILGRNTGKFKAQETGFFPFKKSAVLMDISQRTLLKVAMNHPHLNTLITRGAELFSLMEIKHLDKKGDEIEDSPVVKFLRQPNPLQTQEQYTYSFYIFNAVYNKTFQHLIRPLSFELPVVMWLLPPGRMKVNVTGKIFRQTKIEDIIENYEMYGETVPFEVQNILYMAEGAGETPLNPISRVEALQIPLSNLMESLKARNIIISERGAIGLLSRTSTGKDADGFMPPNDDEKKRIEDRYQEQYNLDSGRGHILVTSEEYKWIPINFDIKQLGLSEGDESDFARLCDSLGHDRDLYASSKGATFENKAQGVKSTIQLGIQPTADKLMRQLSKSFGLEAKGESLAACYDHLPAMKEDERLAAQGKLYRIQGLSIAYRDNVISADQYAQEAELEMDGSGEAPVPQPLYAGNQNPPKDE